MSLNNLAVRFRDEEGANSAWTTAILHMQPGYARADLRTAWANRLAAVGREHDARSELRQAAHEADEQLTNQPERSATVLVMRARQAVRALATNLDSPIADLPIWASAPIASADIDLVNSYATAHAWPAQYDAVVAERELFTSPEFRTALQVLAGLYPTSPAPLQLLALLAEIDESEIDVVFARHQDDHDRRALLHGWISTTTWSESQTFLGNNLAALTEAPTVAILATADGDSARQHLAILQLVGMLDDERAYAVVTEPSAAEGTILDAIETGDLALLRTTFTAATGLKSRPATWHLAAAVLLLAKDKPDRAIEFANQIVSDANPLQRQAQAIRLRALQEHVPDLPGLADLLALIDPAAEASV